MTSAWLGEGAAICTILNFVNSSVDFVLCCCLVVFYRRPLLGMLRDVPGGIGGRFAAKAEEDDNSSIYPNINFLSVHIY